MTAARTGAADAVQALLDHHADVNAKETTRGQTALMWAAGEGHVETIKALVARGADLKTRENGGWTAFLFAAREGQIDAVRALLALGADVNETLVPPAGGRGRGRYPEVAAGVAGAPPARGPAAPPGGPSALVL